MDTVPPAARQNDADDAGHRLYPVVALRRHRPVERGADRSPNFRPPFRTPCLPVRPAAPGRASRSDRGRHLADFDFVIGGGSGGVACARRAASHGARGDRRMSRVGGTCVIRGRAQEADALRGALRRVFPACGLLWLGCRDAGVAFERRSSRTATGEISRLNGIYIRMLESAGVRLFEGQAAAAGAGRGGVPGRGCGRDRDRCARAGRRRRQAARPGRARGQRAGDDLR